ncbi:MAG: hypothetical protein ACLTTU_12315 [Bilophila wadsworthia]
MLADLLWLGFQRHGDLSGRCSSTACPPALWCRTVCCLIRYVYFAVPAAFTLQSFRILQRWYRHFRGGVSILGQQQEEV